MIGFFRRIRKKLADENKFIQYSRYAIGEIVLVVIGILIALSINNWNEQRINKIEEVRVLRDLKEEIGPAITARKKNIIGVDKIRVRLATVLDKLFSTPIKPLTDQECRSIWQINFQNYDVPYLSVVEELIVSGNISIVQNKELRKQLIGFRNQTKISKETFKKSGDKIHSYPDEYANLIFRSWDPPMQKAIFICDTPEMTKSKPFLSQLQTDRGRLLGYNFAAQNELKYLIKIDSLLNINN